MLPREGVFRAIDYSGPDMVPLRIFPAPGRLYEHGQPLLELIRETGHDFGDLSDVKLPEPPSPEDLKPDGSYHALKSDEWGTV